MGMKLSKKTALKNRVPSFTLHRKLNNLKLLKTTRNRIISSSPPHGHLPQPGPCTTRIVKPEWIVQILPCRIWYKPCPAEGRPSLCGWMHWSSWPVQGCGPHRFVRGKCVVLLFWKCPVF